MPTPRPSRSAATRAAATAALLLALTGCSLFDRDSGSGTGAADRGASTPSDSPSSPAASGDASVSTVEETCARVLEAARTAPEQLQQDPAALLAEVEDLAATAPSELSGQIGSVRDAVDEFRQGDRSMISVVREARALQERCSG